MCDKIAEAFSCTSRPECCDGSEIGYEGTDDDLNAAPIFDEILVVRGLREGPPEFMRNHPALGPSGELLLPAFPDARSTDDKRRLHRRAVAETSHIFLDQERIGSAMLGTPACLYQADQTDPIDVLLLRSVRALDEYSRATLLIRRRAPGSYEIDGRRVYLRLGNVMDPSSVTVVEEGAAPGAQEETPLPAYLQLAANVAVSLGGEQARSIRRLQKSFDASGLNIPLVNNTSDLDSLQNGDRTTAMRVACQESRFREASALAAKARLDSISPVRSRHIPMLKFGL